MTSSKTVPSGNYAGNFGDLAFQARFRLIEQRNYSVIAFLGERTPTGFSANGNNINIITPSLEGWWNFARKWVVRGGTGINVRTNHISQNADIYFNRLALGRYVTGKDALIFKDLALYGTATILSDATGQANHVTDVYVGPGARFGMGKDQKLAVSFAVQAPVTGPQSYAWQPSISALMKY